MAAPSEANGHSPVCEDQDGQEENQSLEPCQQVFHIQPAPASRTEDLPVYDDPTGSMLSSPLLAELVPAYPENAALTCSRSRQSSSSSIFNSQAGRSASRAGRKKPTSVYSLRGPRSRSRVRCDASLGHGPSSAISSPKRPRPDLNEASPNEISGESGFFKNLSSLFKGKVRSLSQDSRVGSDHGEYQYSVISKSSRRSVTRSFDSRRSTSRRSSRSCRSKSGVALCRASFKDNEGGLRGETDSFDGASLAPSNSASTSTSDSSSSSASGGRNRANRSADVRVEVYSLRNVLSNPTPAFEGTCDTISQDQERSKIRPPLSQPVFFTEDDLQVEFIGWRSLNSKSTLWTLGCLFSAGTLWLWGRWKGRIKLRCKGVLENFSKATHVIAYTPLGEPEVLEINRLNFHSPISLSAMFLPSMRPPRAQPDESLSHSPEFSHEPTLPVPTDTALPADPQVTQLCYIDFRYHRLFLHPTTQEFYLARGWFDPAWLAAGSLMRLGLQGDTHSQRLNLFGPNLIEIHGKRLFQLLVDEVLHPFYMFQIVSIVLWSIDNYYYYACCIGFISVASITSTLVETKQNHHRMQQMSQFVCTTKVFRDGDWKQVDSTTLVPGDVIDVSDHSLDTFPADLLLLAGDAIVNEAMLTGESIPVSKLPLGDSVEKAIGSFAHDISPSLAKHVLFSGTSIIRVRKPSQVNRKSAVACDYATAMVFRTGFNTTKGTLVRSILFPKPIDFAFYRDSFRFIGALAVIAVLGFMASCANFIRMGIDWHTILLRALDLVTIVVPPALPATMSIGTSFSMSRLRKLGIFCTSPNRVNVAGKVSLVCFDKTGTLTEEGLDVLGVRTVDRKTGSLSELYEDIEDVPILGSEDLKTPLMHALAACHGLKVVHGHVVGDPLDLRVFEFTRWSMEEVGDDKAVVTNCSSAASPVSHVHQAPSKVLERQSALVQTIVRPPGGTTFEIEDAMKSTRFLELGIIRTFDFASELRRMSVLVKKLKSASIEAYVKGAPEALCGICCPDSLPHDYEACMNEYTKHGYRVIAVAAKSFPKLSWHKAQRLTRAEVECELRFLGFVIFENRLKANTEPAIQLLQSAHIGTRMCTGDNIRTAISVGRECGMLHPSERVYMPVFESGGPTIANSSITWFDVEEEQSRLEPYTLMPVNPVLSDQERASLDSLSSSFLSNNYVLAVSGDVFRWIMDYAPMETVERMLYKAVIFARMSPDEKQELVEKLQKMDYTVGFCGDGANDCGALKAADVGLSLSEAEASAAAPFTSQQAEITCFIDLIREGRCALVTSFSCFKYMALYSLIQFTTITLLYVIPSSLGDFQFLYIDLFIIIPIAIAMGRTLPYKRVAAKRPTASLVSKKVLISLVGQVGINSAIQFLVYFRAHSQSGVQPHIPLVEQKLSTLCTENSSLFLVSVFQYILVAATFSVGPPYRKKITSNAALMSCLSILSVFSVYLLFASRGVFFRYLELVDLEYAFRLELLLWVIFNVMLSWAFEVYAAQVVALWIGAQMKIWRKRYLWMGRGLQDMKPGGQKRYKVIAANMLY